MEEKPKPGSAGGRRPNLKMEPQAQPAAHGGRGPGPHSPRSPRRCGVRGVGPAPGPRGARWEARGAPQAGDALTVAFCLRRSLRRQPLSAPGSAAAVPTPGCAPRRARSFPGPSSTPRLAQAGRERRALRGRGRGRAAAQLPPAGRPAPPAGMGSGPHLRDAPRPRPPRARSPFLDKRGQSHAGARAGKERAGRWRPGLGGNQFGSPSPRSGRRPQRQLRAQTARRRRRLPRSADVPRRARVGAELSASQ